MSAGYPVARPRRLRRTAAIRRLVAPVSLRPADLVLPLFVKEGISEPQPVSSMPGVVQHTRDSLRKAAAEAVDGRGRRADPVRHPGGQRRPRVSGRRSGRHRPAGPRRPGRRGRRRRRADGRPVPGRVHRPRSLRDPDGVRRGRQRRDPGAVRVDRGRAGRGRRGHGRAERDDGRPGRRDPGRAGRAPRSPTSPSAPIRRNTRRPFTGRSARRRSARRSSATGPPISRRPGTRARRCGKSCSTSTRAPTS